MASKPQSGGAGSVAGVVLAAGKGTRMKSATPKVLHRVAGRPMVEWVLGALDEAGVAKACVVLSEDLTGFEAFLERRADLAVAIQSNRKGTGDAVASAAFAFDGVKPATFAAGRRHGGPSLSAEWTLVCTGDTPALRGDVLKAFLADVAASGAVLGVLGFRPADPKGYGRLVGSPSAPERELEAIVEDRDTTAAQKAITVCNTGMIAAKTDVLFDLVRELEPNNDQREYYLTDCVSLARKRGLKAVMHVAPEARDFAGINDREQLAAVEKWMISRRIASAMAAGATVHLPETVYLEPQVEVGTDVEIEAGSWLGGATKLGARCRIGAGARLMDCVIGDGAVVGAGAVLEKCSVAAGETVPPQAARLG